MKGAKGTTPALPLTIWVVLEVGRLVRMPEALDLNCLVHSPFSTGVWLGGLHQLTINVSCAYHTPSLDTGDRPE
jgi:hypothetical protein